MGDLVLRRWKRYGQDRVYVATIGGVDLGWRDLKTGQTVIQAPEHAADLEAALAAYVPTVPEPRSSVEPAVVPTEPAELPWRDLALNRPGQAAREQAQSELAVMRQRSRIGTFIARTFDMKTDERAWRVGAGGEETVGEKLEKLVKHGWHVLHAVPVGDKGSDIDHVVIGPGGVYTVNTKTHPGKSVWVSPRQIRVNGQPVPYLRNSRFEGARAERLLTDACGFPVFVKPVIVFLTGTLIPNVTIRERPDDVVILDRMDIPGAFKRAPVCLTPEQVAAVFEHARRSSTWVTA